MLLLPLSAAKPKSLPHGLLEKARAVFAQKDAEEKQRIATYGKIRPIMHIPDFHGKILVTVGSRFYERDQESTFTNFLFDYGLGMFGDNWIDQQNALPLEQMHPLVHQHLRAKEFFSRQPVKTNGMITVVPNGSASFCEHLYYDLYVMDDNGFAQDDILERLRNRDQFQGAMHEVFVGATCLRAGFTIPRDDIPNPNRQHVEYIAIHQETGQHILVEAKSRHRPGVLGEDGDRLDTPDFRFGSLIRKAGKKDPTNPLAIFIDTNLPVEFALNFYKPNQGEDGDAVLLSDRISKFISEVRKENDGIDPYNVLIFSNHPQHYSDGDTKAPSNQWAAYVSDRPRVPLHSDAAVKAIFDALKIYDNVPTDFPEPQR